MTSHDALSKQSSDSDDAVDESSVTVASSASASAAASSSSLPFDSVPTTTTNTTNNTNQTTTNQNTSTTAPSRSNEAMKQLFCGGLAGSIAKTVTAPFSRLTILFQVHSMVTTKNHRPQFAPSMVHGMMKIIERGGILSLWRGNMTSVLHRFPYSAINFYVYEHTLDILSSSSSSGGGDSSTSTTGSSSAYGNTTGSSNANSKSSASSTAHGIIHTNTHTRISPPLQQQQQQRLDEPHETSRQLVRRLSKIVFSLDPEDENMEHDDDDYLYNNNMEPQQHDQRRLSPHSLQPRYDNDATSATNTTSPSSSSSSSFSSTSASHKFLAGAVAGVSAVTMCYPLDLVRTRLSTELEGREHYRGITDAFLKIYRAEGLLGFYSGLAPTLLVAVPNFAISYTTYGTLKEYMIDDDLFYNLRRIDTESGEKSKLGFLLTVACGAASGILATLITFPMDTIRRRMQVQNLHVPTEQRITSVYQQLFHLIHHEGLISLYRGLTPELIKVVPMVGTMFFVYERTKEFLNVNPERHNHR